MIVLKGEVIHVLINLLQSLFKQTPSNVSVDIDCSDCLLRAQLCANGRRMAWIQCVKESDAVILIGDIQHSNGKIDYNKGYGSLLMDALLQHAREKGFKKIHGNLSVVDLDHKDRLHHFYEKFGFTITEHLELQVCYYGEINMQL